MLCRGKHLPTYTPSMDMGAFVIVINAEKVQVSGNKFSDKMYFSHNYNGRPGSGKMESFKDLQKVHTLSMSTALHNAHSAGHTRTFKLCGNAETDPLLT
jgi:ribosomal protein L13